MDYTRILDAQTAGVLIGMGQITLHGTRVFTCSIDTRCESKVALNSLCTQDPPVASTSAATKRKSVREKPLSWTCLIAPSYTARRVGISASAVQCCCLLRTAIGN